MFYWQATHTHPPANILLQLRRLLHNTSVMQHRGKGTWCYLRREAALNFAAARLQQQNSTRAALEKRRNPVSLRHEDKRRCHSVKTHKTTGKQVVSVAGSTRRPPYLTHSLLRYWLNCEHLVPYRWQLHRHALLHALLAGHYLWMCAAVMEQMNLVFSLRGGGNPAECQRSRSLPRRTLVFGRRASLLPTSPNSSCLPRSLF